MNNFVPGHLCPAAFKAAGLAGYTLLNVKSHNLDTEVMLHDVTHTGTGGQRMRIGGVMDAKGTVTADFDLDASPYLAVPLIQAGVRGVMLFYYNPLSPFQVPVIVRRLRFEQALEQAIRYTFDVEMSVNAGVFVYPVV